METITLKSKEEIEQLKDQWLYDPIWDIEETEGFEHHKEELLAFRETHKQQWAKERLARIWKEMEEMGIEKRETYDYLKGLEFSISQLEKRIERLEG